MLLSGQSGASLETRLELCSNPNQEPRSALLACRSVVDSAELEGAQQALVWHNIGLITTDLRQFGEAIQAFGRALRLDPALTASWVARAQVRLEMGMVEPALADYDSAIEAAPDAPEAWFGRGVLHLSNEAPEKAVADFTKAAELDPSSTLALFNRGIAQLALGDAEAAVADFGAVIALDETDAAAHLNRGRALAILGRPEAIDDFNRAVALQPEWSQALVARGQIHDAAGEVEAANRDFLRAYELGAAQPWLIDRVRRITGG